ncbi:cytochrome c3 family protein [Vibrio sp. M60_M31a]
MYNLSLPPHGSVNKAMLNKRLPMLCQECHRVPHANVAMPENDLKVRGGSCMNCHTLKCMALITHAVRR